MPALIITSSGELSSDYCSDYTAQKWNLTLSYHCEEQQYGCNGECSEDVRDNSSWTLLGFTKQVLPTINTDRKVIPTTNTDRKVIPMTNTDRQVIPTTNTDRQVLPTTNTDRQVLPTTNTDRKVLPTTNTDRCYQRPTQTDRWYQRPTQTDRWYQRPTQTERWYQRRTQTDRWYQRPTHIYRAVLCISTTVLDKCTVMNSADASQTQQQAASHFIAIFQHNMGDTVRETINNFNDLL